MKWNLTIFLFAFILHPEFPLAQSHSEINDGVSYVDSAIYYCEQCQNAKGIDTATFYKAIEMVNQMKVNQHSILQIEKITEDFKKKNKSWFSTAIIDALIYKVIRSDSLDLAIRYCKNIINNYENSRNPDERFVYLHALIDLRIPLREKNIPETFDYYTSRIEKNLEKNDSASSAITYFCLGTTYRLTGLPDMTIYNLKKSLSYINTNDTLTELPQSGLRGWVNNISVLGQLYIEVGEYKTAIAYSQEARDVRINKLKDPNVSFLNCNIAYAKLMLNELEGVNELLNNSIQLATVSEDYPSLVRTYEIKGQYFLAINQLDSAEYILFKSKEAMRNYGVKYFSPAGSLTPNYYLAKVRILQNRLKEARALLEQEIYEIRNIKKEVLKEQKLLIEVYHKLGDSKAADSTFIKYYELQTEISAEDRKNRSMSFEVETKIEAAENTIKDLETENRIANLTKKFLIGIAVLLLVVAAIIFNRFRVTHKQKLIIEKEKQRSEELLLNILPSEVAEELKMKGSADAKHFNQVTVMFTDFKGFTQISEKLTAAELVAEIDLCFKTFDRIISKYNIEKIKTIGDAYMCAGGLPVANNTHAHDVVSAAMEIGQFMQQHFQQRKSAGKEGFEIRIGIHSGSVVAGIVGVKKFAYDIWGDTVNLAARMESSGEAGKVNISGTTYELVKDYFKCEYRGKIRAKNKGEFDMYFVEQSKNNKSI